MICTGDHEQFLIIPGQLAVRRLAEIAGVRFLSVYQQYGGADLAAVLQDWHIQERQRGCHVPAVVGVQAVGMVATWRFVVGVVVLYKLRCILRQRINYATRQRIAAVFDKQGLFPNMERVSGIRKFGDTEIEALRVIECLKKAGMEIKDIRQFMDWCVEGPSTYPQRKALFEEQRSHMEAELEQMNRTLDMLKFKYWYYEQAIKDGSEDRLKSLIPDRLPEEIRKAYENAHS